MAAYQAVPDGGARRAVIVIQEAFGVNDHIQDVTRRFADAGYHAIAPALFHRAGGGTAPYDDFNQVLPLFEGLTDPGIVMDVEAAVAHLHGAGFDDGAIGIVGFCMGGRVTFLVVARARAGRGGRLLRRRHRHRPVPAVPAARSTGSASSRRRGSACSATRTRRSRSRTSSGSARSSTAPTCPPTSCATPAPSTGSTATPRPSYNAEAATDAWGRTLAWFEEHLEPRD